MSASILGVAAARQKWEQTLAETTAYRASQLWGKVEGSQIRGSWSLLAPVLFVLVANAQKTAALAAGPYIDDVAAAAGGVSVAEADAIPTALAGWSSDGRPLAVALQAVPIATLVALKTGASVAQALDAGLVALQMLARTQIADAFRVATQVEMFTRSPDADALPDGVFKGPKGRLYAQGGDGVTRPYFRPKLYVRQIQPGACSRCIILAGVRYRSAKAFLRHPNCHCIHVPVDDGVENVAATDPKAYFDGLTEAEQDKAFTKAGAEAIRRGADMNQIVNARSGMYTTQGGLLATREGTSKRGFARSVMGSGKVRLMPEEIFRMAGGDRDEAMRLLKAHGYVR